MIAEIDKVSNTDQTAKALVYMRQALALAAKRRGFCAPNPAVGALVCHGDQIVGKGYHHAAGTDHAEVMALKEAGAKTSGATMYVTLEPCGHWGRTPPCVEAVIKAGIVELYYAHADPNPVVKEHDGLQRLRMAGISCYHLPMDEVDVFYQSYAFVLSHKRPWVTTKLAMSLDAKFAGPGGRPVAITSDVAQRCTHERRLFSDVILTSVNTILADDPLLNVRLPGCCKAKPLAVIDTHARMPLKAKCLRSASSMTLFYVHAATERLAKLADMGITCVQTPAAPQGVDLAFVMAYLGRYAHDVWVESGPVLQQALSAGGWVATHLRYIAPRMLGSQATPIPDVIADLGRTPVSTAWRPVGQDSCCQMNFYAQQVELSSEAKIGYYCGLSIQHEIGLYETCVSR